MTPITSKNLPKGSVNLRVIAKSQIDDVTSHLGLDERYDLKPPAEICRRGFV
jgi:hypothetical protein